MTDTHEEENVIHQTITMEGDDDLAPRMYLLVLHVEGGIAVKAVPLPKKIYLELVSRMNAVNKILSEVEEKRKNKESINMDDINYRIAKAMDSSQSNIDFDSSNGFGDIEKDIKKHYDRMYG